VLPGETVEVLSYSDDRKTTVPEVEARRPCEEPKGDYLTFYDKKEI